MLFPFRILLGHWYSTISQSMPLLLNDPKVFFRDHLLKPFQERVYNNPCAGLTREMYTHAQYALTFIKYFSTKFQRF